MKPSLLLLSLAVAGNAWAQFPGPQRPDTGERLTRLFGKHTAFTATAHVVTTDASGAEKENTQMNYAFLDGKLRTEINPAQTKAGKKRPTEMAMADDMGFGQMVVLVLPEKKMSYMIFPGLKSYCEIPPSAATLAASKPSKIETTDLGQEKIDSHPCVKQKLVITSENGEVEEMLQWAAHDLKGFPIQTQMPSGKDTVTTTFRDVKLAKPDAALFELPADFKRYANMQEMMMGAMQQMMRDLQ
jgi:hypothetical protein